MQQKIREKGVVSLHAHAISDVRAAMDGIILPALPHTIRALQLTHSYCAFSSGARSWSCENKRARKRNERWLLQSLPSQPARSSRPLLQAYEPLLGPQHRQIQCHENIAKAAAQRSQSVKDGLRLQYCNRGSTAWGTACMGFPIDA